MEWNNLKTLISFKDCILKIDSLSWVQFVVVTPALVCSVAAGPCPARLLGSSISWAEWAEAERGNIWWLYVPLRCQSEYFVLTCDTDGSESTSELIKLGDTAHSFSKRREGEFGWKKMLRLFCSKSSRLFVSFIKVTSFRQILV